MNIVKLIDGEKDYIIALRRYFHAHPEVSLAEEGTARRIEEELDSFGIPHRRCGKTGVYACLQGERPGSRVIALRADTDALAITETHETPYKSQNPGVMHACGHDAHTACLLGAAKALSTVKNSFGGEVRFFFQHAEEIGTGAKEFIRDGYLDGAQRVFGLHIAPDLATGTVGITPGANNAAVDYFKIRVHGRAAHVSTPNKGVDALYIASQIVVAVQAIITRLTSPTEPALIGIGKLEAGTAYNIVAGSAVLEGTTRTISAQTREQVREQITATAEQISLIYGGTAEVEWVDFASPLINPADICAEVRQQAQELCNVSIVTNRALSLGGDDFAEFQLIVPGVYAHLGTGNPEKPNTLLPAHNGSFDIDEEALVTGVKLYAKYALWWLTHRTDH